MKTNIIRLTNRFFLLGILSAVISCDSLTDDSIKPENQVVFTHSDFYTLPGSTIIIDLKSLIEKSFSNVTVTVSKNPQRGTLSRIDAFLLRYKPGRDFNAGEDQFVISVLSAGTVLHKQTLAIKMKKNKEEFPCASTPSRIKPK